MVEEAENQIWNLFYITEKCTFPLFTYLSYSSKDSARAI
jgi:hypothetical protein